MTLVPPTTVERILAASAEIYRATALAIERVDPTLAPALAPIGTGAALYCGDGSPLTQVGRLAVGAKAHEKELDTVEEFYSGRTSRWEYVVTPFSDPDLVAMVVRRGWTAVQYENVLFRSLGGALPAPPATDVEVSVVGLHDRDTWAEVSTTAFFGDDVPAAMANLGPVISATEGAVGFLARIDGLPAAAATLLVLGDIVYLGGAATLPAFRNRGAQSALLAARLAYARSRGCDLAVCESVPESQSQRNQERAGFHVAFTKMVMTRPADARTK